MPVITLYTAIHADIETVFDLARCIDVHTQSTSKTNEKAIAGRTSGLIGLHETVTWRAKHLGVYQKLTSKITAFERPTYFVDEMQRGAFKSIKHQHSFRMDKGITTMKDVFAFESPLGILGHLANTLLLKGYMARFLEERNLMIKTLAESGEGKKYLNRV